MRDIIITGRDLTKPTVSDMNSRFHSLSIQEMETRENLTKEFELGNKTRSFLLQPIVKSSDDVLNPYGSAFGSRFVRHWKTVVEELSENTFIEWLGLFRARWDQHSINFWRTATPSPDTGSNCRSCDLLVGGVSIAWWQRIKFCQNSYSPKWRGFASRMLRAALPCIGFYIIVMQPCKEDIRLMYNYKTWVNPKLIPNDTNCRRIAQRIEDEVGEAIMSLDTPKETKVDKGAFVSIPKQYASDHDWEAQHIDGIRYRREKQNREDQHRDKSNEILTTEEKLFAKRFKDFISLKSTDQSES